MDALEALAAFNALDEADAARILAQCLDSDRWALMVAGRRPFQNLDDIVAVASAAFDEIPLAEIAEVVSRRPRLGSPIPADNAFSTAEQAEARGTTDDARERVRRANAAYEERFALNFMIRAAGRDTDEVLAEVCRRLQNTRDAEMLEVARELREITVLRLRTRLASAPLDGTAQR